MDRNTATTRINTLCAYLGDPEAKASITNLPYSLDWISPNIENFLNHLITSLSTSSNRCPPVTPEIDHLVYDMMVVCQSREVLEVYREVIEEVIDDITSDPAQ